MKQYVLKGTAALVAGLMTLTVAAQKSKTENKDEEQQVIVITRKGTADDKMIIEIAPGGKVLINGKENNDNVSVNVTKIKDGTHFYGPQGTTARAWNFSIDDNRMSLFAEDSNRAMLGITTDMDDKGAEIVSVNTGSAAEKAGLKKGDIITRIGDTKIEDAEDVTTAVRSRKPGDKVGITLLRDGKEQKFTATLDRYKGIYMRDLAPSRVLGNFNPSITIPPAGQLRGLTFNNNRSRLGLSIQDTDDGKGVKVLDVAEEGAAAKAGVQENDIITHVDGKAVNSTDEISRLVRESKDKSSFELKLVRNGKAQNVTVKTPRKLKTADL